jgi:hypothetical protein
LVVYFLPRVAKSAIKNKKAGINNPGLHRLQSAP